VDRASELREAGDPRRPEPPETVTNQTLFLFSARSAPLRVDPVEDLTNDLLLRLVAGIPPPLVVAGIRLLSLPVVRVLCFWGSIAGDQNERSISWSRGPVRTRPRR